MSLKSVAVVLEAYFYSVSFKLPSSFEVKQSSKDIEPQLNGSSLSILADHLVLLGRTLPNLEHLILKIKFSSRLCQLPTVLELHFKLEPSHAFL